jgi:histone H3/H4
MRELARFFGHLARFPKAQRKCGKHRPEWRGEARECCYGVTAEAAVQVPQRAVDGIARRAGRQ